jgi:predicted nucleotide-binding protein (sugar kinase/HSP70/actin superfamily)
MSTNGITSFFLYMWNAWSEHECSIVFRNSSAGAAHIWGKWCEYTSRNGRYGAVEEFFANLDDTSRNLLVVRALELYENKCKVA